MSNEEENNGEEKSDVIDSGVENVSADDTYKGCPVFDVNSTEFFNNMRKDRNRMRFSNNSKPSQFMKGSKYRKPFYMAYKDKNGEKFLSKVK